MKTDAAPPTATASPSAGAAPSTRRTLLASAAGGVAALVLGALGKPSEVDAAAGSALIMGRTTNSAGRSNTKLTTSSTGTALAVAQNGTGSALSGTTKGSGTYGVNAVNAGAAGSGAAARASGGNNHGLIASTANKAKHAVSASNSAATNGGGAAVRASGGHNYGVDATSIDGSAVRGTLSGSPGTYGFLGTKSPGGPVGVAGLTSDGTGVQGGADTGIAVYAGSDSGSGVYALSNTGVAVYATSSSAAIRGDYKDGTSTFGLIGCHGMGDAVFGVVGHSVDGTGVSGDTETGTGVYGQTNDGTALYGWADTGNAVYGISGSGYALYGDGDAVITGNLEVAGDLTKAGGTFKIDHPADPSHRYLVHSFIESPDRKNVYDGVAVLDASGEVVVGLPGYFDALNRDARIQLTPIGLFSPLFVKHEVKAGRFTIGGGVVGQRVHWQVTGIRKDPWAEAHPLVVEPKKAGAERGTYLHPELYGQPETKGRAWKARAKATRVAKGAAPSTLANVGVPAAPGRTQ